MQTVFEADGHVPDQRIRLFLDRANDGCVEEFRKDLESLPFILNRTLGPGVYDGRSALHLASMKGYSKIVAMILESSLCCIDVVNARDRFGLTPLHLAVRGCPRALSISITRLNRTKPPRERDIWIAREKRIWLSRFERFFKRRGDGSLPPPAGAATPNSTESCQGSSQEEIVGFFTRSSLVLPDRLTRATGTVDEMGLDCANFTPLHYAALTGNSAIVRLLLQQQICCKATGYEPVDLQATTWQGESPLDIAKRHYHAGLVDLLESIDVQWLRAEFDRTANSQNTILVGAALFAGISFGCWLQPPLGVPDPDAEPNPRLTPLVRSKNMALFFMMVAASLAFSLAALMVGIHAIIPIPGLSLHMEVKKLRKSVHRTAILLFMAITFLALAAHTASVLVFRNIVYFEGWLSNAGELFVQEVSLLCFIYIVCLVLASRVLFGWKARATIFVTATSMVCFRCRFESR